MLKKIVVAAAALVGVPQGANAVVLFSDNFDSYTSVADLTAANWVLSGSAPELVSFYGGQGVQLDLDNATTTVVSAITTATPISFVAGRTYQLSFDYGKAVNQQQRLAYLFGTTIDTLILDGPVPGQMLSHVYSFVAATSFIAPLVFRGVLGNRSGMLLDNVVVEDITPVPVPPAALLLATGVVGLGVAARKKRKA